MRSWLQAIRRAFARSRAPRPFSECFDDALDRVMPMTLRVRSLERALVGGTPQRRASQNPRFQRTA